MLLSSKLIIISYLRYAIHPTLATGLCISIITDSCRSLVGNLGAAEVYTLDNLKNAKLELDTAKVLYIEGFFIPHGYEVAKEVIKQVYGKNITVIFNLSGTYIFKVGRNFKFKIFKFFRNIFKLYILD